MISATRPHTTHKEMNPMSHSEKLWTRSFIVLTAANFLTALVYYLIAVKIVEYTMATYGVTHSVAGSMVTSYVIAAIFARLVFGGKIDKWGLKRAIVIGAAVIAVASGLYLVDLGMGFLYVVRIIHGIGFGIETGALAAAAATMVPPSRRGEGIGYFSMSQALATGVGPMVGMLLMDAGASFFMVFLLTFVMSLAALAGCLMADVPQPKGAAATQNAAKASAGASSEKASSQPEGTAPGKAKPTPGLSIRSFISLEALPLCFVMFLVMMGYSVVVSYLTLFAEERDLVSAASLYFLLYSAAILLTRPPMGRRLDRKGENSIMYLTIATVAVGMVTLAFAYNGPVLLASAAMLGFGVGVTQSTVQATVPKLAPANELGKANSTFFICMDAGYGAGPILIGLVIPLAGYQTSSHRQESFRIGKRNARN